MKRIMTILTLVVLWALASCQQEELLYENVCTDGLVEMTFDAVISDKPQTKTSLGENSASSVRNVMWRKSDAIAVCGPDSEEIYKFVNKSSEGKSAKFAGYVAPSTAYYAFYPYSEDIMSGADGFYFSLPSTQTYVEDNIADNSFPMIAKGAGENLSFMNVCGILELNLIGTGIVESVSFSATDASGNPMPLAGKAHVPYNYSSAPSISMGTAIGKVVLNCGKGVGLSESKATPFHIVLPPATYENFEVEINFIGGDKQTKSGVKPMTIRRSERTKTAALECNGSENLSIDGTANAYIVSKGGLYRFKAVKGNSNESVGQVASVETLWESFGTSAKPAVGDLVNSVCYSDGYINFATASTFKEGNAVIAAKDASGNILWSWHIWLTDEPQEQNYYNNAGVMMDRNLGAISAAPGEVGTLGLFYQWGRKDPFLGSSSISSDIEAISTITWPSSVWSNATNGTIEYTIANPTTFIRYNNYNEDWYYTGSQSTDDTRWEESSRAKSIYDPCPVGWRVPDGGEYGVWATAYSSMSFNHNYDTANNGMDFSAMFGYAGTIWYPASGSINCEDGSLDGVGRNGYCWSCSPGEGLRRYASTLDFSNSGNVGPAFNDPRAKGCPVRCIKENSSGPSAPVVYTDLSSEGTANSYIVPASGSYKFNAVKGNSSQSVGNVASVETLWESFGTAVRPSVGDLVRNVSYSDGYIKFSTPSTFREGNAVIAAKDGSGNILWSWHIWLTDKPAEHIYKNNAGTMMDRNLGATSAEPGDVGALGLYYQWGRKDPFLGSSDIANSVKAEYVSYAGPWSSETSTSTIGTIEYSVSHPMTFIGWNENNYDWCYNTTNKVDKTRWTSQKTIYDPCPPGWRVPDGGEDGIWNKAGFTDSYFDNSRKGMNMSISSPSTTWFPACGVLFATGFSVGDMGVYWSTNGYDMGLGEDGRVLTVCADRPARGQSVRCFKIGSDGSSNPSTSGYTDLSANGTANSYIVSGSGKYEFKATQGNTDKTFGTYVTAAVLWESFGTASKPSVGDLIREVTITDGYIRFTVPSSFKEGNAVIAVKSGDEIVWSWHIWLTDQPKEEIYYSGAKAMMDRNLGATSATPREPGALGLLYQWGRKDPFLNTSSLAGNTPAQSTASWPSPEMSSQSTGTIYYSRSHPMVYLLGNSLNEDWLYTGSEVEDHTRWMSTKSEYDPCPPGWRVPTGGVDGIWYKAGFRNASFNKDNRGLEVQILNGTTWYPASGSQSFVNGSIGAGSSGYYWSAVSDMDGHDIGLLFNDEHNVKDSEYSGRHAYGHAVRCMRE